MSVTGWSLADLRSAYIAHAVEETTAFASSVSSTAARTFGTVGVLGVSGGVGTTTVALALAEALQAKRLIELSPPHASGLAGAATAELGERDGWRIGMRGGLELARRLHTVDAPMDVDDGAVVDLGAWTGEMPVVPVDRIVVVASCSAPSVRRLDACLQVLDSSALLVPVVTRAGLRLPREVLGAAGPVLRAAFASGAVRVLPECRGLSLTGLTPDRLPRSLQHSAAGLALALKDNS